MLRWSIKTLPKPPITPELGPPSGAFGATPGQRRHSGCGSYWAAQTANWDGSADQPINPTISLVFLEERYVFFSGKWTRESSVWDFWARDLGNRSALTLNFRRMHIWRFNQQKRREPASSLQTTPTSTEAGIWSAMSNKHGHILYTNLPSNNSDATQIKGFQSTSLEM